LFVFAARLRLALAAFAFRFLAMTYLLPRASNFSSNCTLANIAA
jgi:hypothetical protein